MYHLARAATISLSVLFGVLLLSALAAFSLIGGSSSPSPTEKDFVGTWHGDAGARLEVMPDGRARLTGAHGWRCASDGPPAGFTGEGSWTFQQVPDEEPAILIKLTGEGRPPAEHCSDLFTIYRATEGGSGVRAGFHGRPGGDRERYHRTPAERTPTA